MLIYKIFLAQPLIFLTINQLKSIFLHIRKYDWAKSRRLLHTYSRNWSWFIWKMLSLRTADRWKQNCDKESCTDWWTIKRSVDYGLLDNNNINCRRSLYSEQNSTRKYCANLSMLCQRTINLYDFGIHARRYTGQYDHTFHGSRSTTQGQAYRQFHFANWKRIGMFARNEYHPPGCEFFPHQKKLNFI